MQNPVFDLRYWCTPALISLICTAVVTVGMVSAVVNTDEQSDMNVEEHHALMIILYSLGMSLFLYYLCSIGHVNTSWFLFAAVYLLPVAIGLLMVPRTHVVKLVQ